MRAALGLAAVMAIGCGTGSDVDTAAPAGAPLSEVDGVAGPTVERPQPPPFHGGKALATWQPGFHQALRWEVHFAERITLRTRIPVGRAGKQLRFAFRTGDGHAVLHAATVAAAGSDGSLAGPAVPIRFGGASGFRADGDERILSDVVDFPVGFRDELYVTIEIEGHFAAGAIELFPDSWLATHTKAAASSLDGVPERRAIGLASILVRGAPERAFVALGDSITEAFVDGKDDYRRNWPAIAEELTGLPVANAGVSGQGLWSASRELDEEVLVLPGVTDCLVLLGTNDLGANGTERITDDLADLYDDLRPFCTVWGATLPPKDRAEIDDTTRRERREVNEWIRHEAEVAGVIDFEAVLAEPGEPDRWKAGLGEDGVHPSAAGQRAMGEAAAAFIQNEILAR